MRKNKKARVIAFYLPQFHPIPENDKWWGKGFTEWTNVGKARPLFRGHYQPRVPADLGYYDLRMPEVREAQAVMAREAGIEGFCYWRYWFSSENRLLERPFQEVLESGKPDFPFCLGWANESWTNKSWEEGTRQQKESVLMEQIYNKEDYIKHFNAILPAFKDRRYITVDGKPLFVVFRPLEIPDPKEFISIWQEMAKKNGLEGVYFVGIRLNMEQKDQSSQNIFYRKDPDLASKRYKEVLDAGFDGVNSRGFVRAEFMVRNLMEIIWRLINRRILKKQTVSKCRQLDINRYLYVKEDKWLNVYPTLLPNWDRTPRSGIKSRFYTGSTPEVFKEQIRNALSLLEDRNDEHKLLFLQSWNEWAEGNYVEPDLMFGHGYLDVLRDTIIK
jgi:hypothetical protein